MRIDIVSVFPEYFDVLKLSLLGKAQDRGLIDVRTHNLRDWTHDVHHSVDDTPVGGGAGMVMKPEVWAQCLDDLLGMSAVDFTMADGEATLTKDPATLGEDELNGSAAHRPAASDAAEIGSDGTAPSDTTVTGVRAGAYPDGSDAAAANDEAAARRQSLTDKKTPEELIAALDSLYGEDAGYNVPEYDFPLPDHPVGTGRSDADVLGGTTDSDATGDANGADVTGNNAGAAKSILIFPNPSAPLFTQRDATELSRAGRLVFGCGRYEGIDARVPEYYARQGVEVREYSIGDYVLNGGEVAVSAMIEAIVRLLPGFMGNPESIVEESYTGDPLLEHRQFTKPAAWRGITVPDVLTSGDHGKVDRYRRDEALERTARIRPDLIEQLDCKELSKADRKTLMLLDWEVSGHHPRQLPPERLPMRYF
ncbi:tRNA (guanine(37)-N(1))-methyltransferase [Bifidobacterium simiarum]|uniref:tRNA (guanine(37)-N(1))-methyltransferase n=1 Tax=Bifidobacterium simiarum TaxID=2045441 RepID=UPI001BDC9C21|nr:tRNA (guanine(37)-N(1))-methyltransferase [Bifidobacterium simiarum]MBT1166424.1 tRNA (guanine(37)-N(1))-methyltransferase [Bifidobacterium simiarum]